MSGRHTAHDAATVQWWVSHCDRRAHAYRARGEVYAEAVCKHTAITSKLTEDDGTALRCLACVLIVGGELAERNTRERTGGNHDRQVVAVCPQ